MNNGGVSVRGGALETTLEVHKRLMDINYFGTVGRCIELQVQVLLVTVKEQNQEQEQVLAVGYRGRHSLHTI